MLPVPDGDDLAEALNRGGRGLSGWTAAVGSLEDVEVRVAGEGTDSVHALPGRCTLVSLCGPAGGPYMVAIARATQSGVAQLAGALIRGRAVGVHAVMHPFDPAPAQNAELAAGPPPPRGPQPPAEPATPASKWAAIASAAAAEYGAEDEPPQYRPGPGDQVEHFSFGRCEVLTVSGDSIKIRDVEGPAPIREIRLDMLTVLAPQDQGGKRVFKLVRKK
jgi:hypothetical protein